MTRSLFPAHPVGMVLRPAAIALAATLAAIASTAPRRGQAAPPDTITVYASPMAYVGSPVTVVLSVTSSVTPNAGVRWEVAYSSTLSYAPPAIYACHGEQGGIFFSMEAEIPPTESPFGTLKNMGGACGSIDPTFTGAVQTGRFVNFSLTCLAAGQNVVALRPLSDPTNPLNDATFGTALAGGAGGPPFIPTSLEPQMSVPGFGVQASVGVNCLPPCKWDLNGNIRVDFPDLLIFAVAYNSTTISPNWNPAADFDGNGKVGFPDLLPFAQHYGQNPCVP